MGKRFTGIGIGIGNNKIGNITGSNVIIDSNVSGSFNQSHKTPSDDDIANFIKLIAENLPELKLSLPDKDKVNAQIATINAQLSTEPDRTILNISLNTLKSVLESAIGSILANGVKLSDIWIGIRSFLSNF